MKVVLQNLTKKFNGRGKNAKPVVALDNFRLEIPDGTLVGLLGPSGCGKSTALNLVCGLLSPTEGKIFFGDEDVTSLPPEKRGVGMVFQNYALYPHLTVRQNIIFPLENLKGRERLKKAQMNEKALAAAKLVQIEELMDRKPAELSGGQQQRVAIARALVKMPRVLLLDEPLSNLDARLRLRTREEIKRIQRETGITTVFVTHDQDEALSISDMIAVMNKGVLQQVGEPQSVYDDPVNLFVAKFLGTPPINVFEGRISGGALLVGNDTLMETDAPDGEVYVAIRPEGFIPDPDGRLKCKLKGIDVMGRDISILSSHEAAGDATIRSIINSSYKVDTAEQTVSFSVAPSKLFVFDKATEKRIYITRKD